MRITSIVRSIPAVVVPPRTRFNAPLRSTPARPGIVATPPRLSLARPVAAASGSPAPEWRPPLAVDQLVTLRGTWGDANGVGLRVSAANDKGRVEVEQRLPNGEVVHCVDFFDYEESHYTRIMTDASGKRRIFVSGGWRDERFEWKRIDCGESIVYEQLSRDELRVTYARRGQHPASTAVVQRLPEV